MTFAEKLCKLRKEAGWTQEQAAERIGIRRRRYMKYENGTYPREREIYAAIAAAFGVDKDYLLTESEGFVSKAAELYGCRGKKQAEELVARLSGMFTEGELSDADKDAVMNSLQRAYFMSKEINKKYTPVQYRTED